MVYIIILLILAGALWFFGKKAKGFYKGHEFTIKYILLSFLFVTVSATLYDSSSNEDSYYNSYYYENNNDLNTGLIVSLCIVVALYIVMRLLCKPNINKFYDNNRYTINSIFISSIVVLLLSAFIKSVAVTIICTIAAAVICIYIRISYQSRVIGYISKYIYNIANGIDKQNLLTEAHFFSQPEAKRLLNQGYKINDMSPLDFMRAILRDNVINGIKKEFIEGLEESENKDIGRIFFYYEYIHYLPYLEEQGINLIDCIDDFGIINSSYWYIEDVAFFSNVLLEDAISVAELSIRDTPKLSDVPFSLYYFINHMYGLNFLNSYVTEYDLDGLKNKPELFKDDFDALYNSFGKAMLDVMTKNNRIIKTPSGNEENEFLYSYNHEDEDGIIKEEYGQQFEAHRVPMDVDISQGQLDELAGCPA